MATTETDPVTETPPETRRLPDGELTSAMICDPANAGLLRAHTLDVSNTQFASGTGLTPVKGTTPAAEVAEIEKTRPVVVAPDPSGLPQNRELAALSPGHTPEEMGAAPAATPESPPETT